MKKNPPKYLTLYYEWMKGDFFNGLCHHFDNSEHPIFELVIPNRDERDKLKEEGLPSLFWGRGSYEVHAFEFTPLRQTIVLLMAAMNNEL